MKRRKIVVALGGNAIQSGNATAEAQQKALERTAEQLVKIMGNNIDIVIAHGNGPQVGNILLQQKSSRNRENTGDAIGYLRCNEPRNDWVLDGKCN
ncbi:amino acid kinase family protein [Bacillus cytotoxicus]